MSEPKLTPQELLRLSRNFEEELVIPLPRGGTLRCGPGIEYQWGGYLRICDPDGKELFYWEAEEWERTPEEVIGAVFGAASQQ